MPDPKKVLITWHLKEGSLWTSIKIYLLEFWFWFGFCVIMIRLWILQTYDTKKQMRRENLMPLNLMVYG